MMTTMTTLTLPEVGEVRYPNDPQGRGHYVVVLDADEDWVQIRCFYQYLHDEPHVRRIRLSTYLARYALA